MLSAEINGIPRVTLVEMDLFQISKLLEAMIVFSTIVSGSFCIGNLLRLCCEAAQDIVIMVFIEYLSHDFGLSSGKLRELDITFFTVPFKLAHCVGTFFIFRFLVKV